jgi:hypothetical protein
MRELSDLRHLDEGDDVVGTGHGIHGKDRGEPAKRARDAFDASGKSLNEHVSPDGAGRGLRSALGFRFSFHAIVLE